MPRRTADAPAAVAEHLEQSRSLHRIAGEVGHIGGWTFDLDERQLIWSDEVLTLLEHPVTDDVEVDAIAACRPADRVALAAAIEACRTDGTSFDLEVEVATRTGRWLRARIVAEPQHDADGTVRRIIGAFQDISELHAAREAARAAGERLALTLDRVSDGLCVLSNDLEVTYVNARAAAALQAPIERLLGRPLWEGAGVRWPELSGACREAVDERVTLVLPEVEVAALSAWIEVRVDPTDHGLAVSFHDVTRQRAAREALQRREVVLADQAALLDTATDAIVVRDLEHRITYWNRSAERLYGWSADEAIGRSIRDLLHPEDPSAFDAAQASLLAEDAWAGVLTPRRRDGGEVIIEARLTLVRDPGGRPRSVLAIATDVTEQRRMEHQLARAQRLQAVGTLAGGLAHDLRNVLTPVLMSLELLRDGETDPLRLEVLETVERNTRRGTDIVAQVLSFARGVDGRRVEVAIEPLLHELAGLVQQTFPPDIELRVLTSPGVGAVRGDPTQIHQILVNLLLNARDAMPDGGQIELRASEVTMPGGGRSREHPLAPGPYVRLEVEDTGQGMPREISDRIFEPFFTTKTAGDGTGLGLSTAHTIVASHDGDIAVDSRPGEGTTFTVHLPAARTTRPAPRPARPPDAEARGSGEVVLLVDDEPLVRRLACRTLERAGYAVLEAGDGVAALEVIDDPDARIDLLLTDLLMPRIGGRELVFRLRAARPAVPVLISSGLPPANGGAEVPGSTWLSKPFTAADLLRQVQVALGTDLGPRAASAARQPDSDGSVNR
ncbi:hybrid sensor histidine kinase/response regulator [Nitriliruptor alkaliphilus]|uniref:hybrid sensor histidine kinase/response regulator n=1 Tax=Nitriliruptor alkaliphilus TaxID=427918 RepID=UPI000699172D|nr:PAS domain S-box protein [Nitriliruptor alkaliphilus]